MSRTRHIIGTAILPLAEVIECAFMLVRPLTRRLRAMILWLAYASASHTGSFLDCAFRSAALRPADRSIRARRDPHESPNPPPHEHGKQQWSAFDSHRPGPDQGVWEITFPAVATPTRLEAPARQTDGSFRFNVAGEAGRTYEISASTNLLDWLTLTNLLTPGGVFQFADPTARNFPQRFYRASPPE
jgi:hypothetical protein